MSDAIERMQSQSALGTILLDGNTKLENIALRVREVNLVPDDPFALLFLPDGNPATPDPVAVCSIPLVGSSGQFGQVSDDQTFGLIWQTLDGTPEALVFRLSGASGVAPVLNRTIDPGWSVEPAETPAEIATLDDARPSAIVVEPGQEMLWVKVLRLNLETAPFMTVAGGAFWRSMLRTMQLVLSMMRRIS